VGNLLGCLYVGCVGCGAARSLLLFGYVSLYCVATLLICICFLPLPSHRGCRRRSSDRGPPSAAVAGGLLGGLGAWRGGSGGISKRGCGLGWSCCFVSFRFLCIEAAAGDHAIEVHRCCCPGGLLGGLSVGGHLLFQLCMGGPMGRRLATIVIDGGGYLEEGFRGGTLRPPSFAWRWP
jgi:hypothetical protein